MLALEELTRHRIVPVVVLKDAAGAAPLAEALLAGGLPVAEVTLRTEAGLASIRTMAQYPDMLVGAGTVLSAEQVDQVADAGARFVVSPGLSRTVVERAQSRGLLVLPGAVTPTEIMAALDLGLTTVKFFPAKQYGGIATIKALGEPFRGVRFIPTGGVSADNLADYLALPHVPAVGGTWMVKPSLVDAGDFGTVTRLAADAVARATQLPRSAS